MRTEVVTITPEVAAEWLERWNILNRPVSRSNVDDLARAIRERRWLLTGEPITFSERRLIQGQHRLLAIVAAGIPVQSLVIWGVVDDAFDILDQGKRRSAADVLASHGHENANTIAAMMPYIWAYERERGSFTVQRYEKLSPGQIAKQITQRHIDASKKGRSVWVKRMMPPGMTSAIFYITHAIDPALADAFWADVASDAPRKHNATLLATRLMRQADNQRDCTKEHKFAWAACAWNAERDGVRATKHQLRYSSGTTLPRFI